MRNPIRTSTALFVLSGLLGGAPHAPAQQDPATRIRSASDPVGPIISVEFAGGTVNEFIAAVQKAAAPAPVNVIRPAEAANVQTPPISFRNVTVKTALESLRWAFQDAGEHRFQVDDFGGDAGSEPVYAVRYSRFKRTGEQVDPRSQVDRQIEVFSIRDLIEPSDPRASPAGRARRDDILAAIDTALRLGTGDNQPPPEIKFHEDTGLLIVRGNGDQLNVVKSLLLRVREDLKNRRSDAADFGQRLRAMEAELRQATTQMQVKAKELKVHQDRLERVRKLRESGTVPEDEVATAELQVMRSEGDMQMLAVRVDQLDVEITQLRAASGSGAAAPVEATVEIADLAGASKELEGLARSLGLDVERRGEGKNLTLVIRGQPPQHDQFKQALAAVRKAAGAAGSKNPR